MEELEEVLMPRGCGGAGGGEPIMGGAVAPLVCLFLSSLVNSNLWCLLAMGTYVHESWNRVWGLGEWICSLVI